VYTGFWLGNLRARDKLNDIDADEINFLLTPYSRILLEKLNVSQVVKKFPAIYGTRRFITAFTRTHNLFLS